MIRGEAGQGKSAICPALKHVCGTFACKIGSFDDGRFCSGLAPGNLPMELTHSQTDISLLVPSTRICTDDGRQGSVRFRGPLPGRPPSQIFIGVEFDNADDGKHDGSFQTFRIFGPTQERNAGSFFDTAQLVCYRSRAAFCEPLQKSGVFLGISLEEAIRHKYENTTPIPPVAFGAKTVEIVLPPTDTNATEKAILSVPAYHVISCDVSEPCFEVRELDLSDNMLWNWEQCANSLSVCFPQLGVVNLSGNPLRVLRQPQLRRFGFLKTLVVNRCTKLGWDGLSIVLEAAPSVVELHFAAAGLGAPTDSARTSQAMQAISDLTLSQNKFGTWGSLEWLSKLPALRRLVVNDCGISTITVPSGSFSSLLHLSISDNPIQSWTDVAQLTNLPVRDLRIQRAVFGNLPDSIVRLYLSALFPHLVSLNGSSISEKERADGERLVLTAPSCDLRSVLGSNQLSALAQKHPGVSQVTTLPDEVGQSLIALTLLGPFGSSVEREIPLSTTIGKLLALFRRSFDDLSTVDFILIWASAPLEGELLPLDALTITVGEILKPIMPQRRARISAKPQ